MHVATARPGCKPSVLNFRAQRFAVTRLASQLFSSLAKGNSTALVSCEDSTGRGLTPSSLKEERRNARQRGQEASLGCGTPGQDCSLLGPSGSLRLLVVQSQLCKTNGCCCPQPSFYGIKSRNHHYHHHAKTLKKSILWASTAMRPARTPGLSP
ncbi:uncharacterized protein LOC144295505 [Canis aureus]